MYISLSLMLFLTFFVSRIENNKPPLLLLYVWVLIYFFYILSKDKFYPLIYEVNLYIVSFLFFFVVVYFVGGKVFAFSVELHHRLNISPGLYLLFSFFCSIYTLIIGFVEIKKVGFDFAIFRELIMSGSVSNLGIGFVLPITFSGVYLSRLLNKKILFFVFSVFSIFISILSTSKIFLVISLLYIVGLDGRISRYKILIVFLSCVFLFILSSIMLEKYSSNIDDGMFSALYDTFMVYLLSGLSAFNLLVDGKANLPENIIFYPFKDMLEGVMLIPDSDILPWIDTGTWESNVYTGFAPWYQLCGFFSSIVFGVLLGAYYSFWFNENLKGSINYYRVYLYFPLLSLFFQEHFILSYKMHISYFMCMFLLSNIKIENKYD